MLSFLSKLIESKPNTHFIGHSAADAQTNYETIRPTFGTSYNYSSALETYTQCVNRYLVRPTLPELNSGEEHELVKARENVMKNVTGLSSNVENDTFMATTSGISNYILRVGRATIMGENLDVDGRMSIEQATSLGTMSDPQMMRAVVKTGLGKEADAIVANDFFKQQNEDLFDAQFTKGQQKRAGIDALQMQGIKDQVDILNELTLQLVRNAQFNKHTALSTFGATTVKSFEPKQYDKMTRNLRKLENV